ncbi:SUKH-4 family immunity protein [Streptomyces nigra]|uniref:SUKH-4 family immunity protein n=1 Tax=Streptomyces nigra TaxID=1827580 RepID=UPI0013DDEF69|nr:SUKH-4 family immunity protein [Streptomyces nigra]
MDATGLTAEEVLGKILDAFEVPDVWPHRVDWAWRLQRAGVGSRPLLIANSHRAGPTRRSAQHSRVLKRMLAPLLTRAGARVIVESGSGVDGSQRNWLSLHLETWAGAVPGLSAARSRPALRALAFAESRWTPLPVWSTLVRATAAGIRSDEDALVALAQELPDIVELAGGRVRFTDERIAEALREETPASDRRRIHARVMTELLFLVEHLTAPEGWAATGPVGHYLAHALPAHALQAERLEEVQSDGRLVAHIAPAALLDAANLQAAAIPNETLAGDAASLWVAGVGSVSQPEWAAWLHLMATVRGDARTSVALEHSGIVLPWRTRWAHWRPPYGWRARHIRDAGPVAEISEVEVGGRVAVAGKGRWDRRVRVWDAQSGELIAGPWSDGIPAPGQSEPLWPRGRDNQLAQAWSELNAVGSSLAGPQFTEVVRVGDGFALAGIGGVVMVAPREPEAFKGLERNYGAALLGHFGLVDNNAHDFWEEPDRAVLEDLFEPQAVQRLDPAKLPPGLRDDDARHVLCEVGLPAFTGAEMSLVAVAEEGLTELTAEEVWGEDDGAGASYYHLGTWLDGRIVVHGHSGTVLRLPAEGEENDSDPQVAATLGQFVTMLQNYVLGRCLLPMASSRTEREDVRDEIEDSLTAIDEDGGASRAWTYALYDND